MEGVPIERTVVCRKLATLTGQKGYVSDREVFVIKIQLTSTGKRPSGDLSYGDGGGRCTGVADMEVGGTTGTTSRYGKSAKPYRQTPG